MIKQKIFKYNFKKGNKDNDFYTNNTNIDAFHELLNNFNNKLIFLTGPKKSGKYYGSSRTVSKIRGHTKINSRFNITC